MTKQSSAGALALLLGALAAQAGCSGAIEPILSPPAGGTVGGPGSVSGGRDGGTSASSTDGEDKPSGIGTQVFALCGGGPEAPSPRLLRLLTRREYQNTVQSLLFVQDADVSNLPIEPRVRGYDNNAGASVVTSRHVDEYMSASEALVKKALAEQRGQLVPCQASEAGCASKFVQTFGRRAFRRPLRSDEQARYEAMFAADLTGGDFDQGVALAMRAMLVSPSFLYRSEVGEPQADGSFVLTPYEIASALSYLYWGSMPDQALFDAAERGALQTKAQREAEARRLLADARASAQLAAFSLQWLRSDNALNAFKDKAIYPAFTDSLRGAMLEEQARFVTDVALTRDGKFGELFRADYVFANDELARFYGLSPQGNTFSKLSVPPASQRGGLLGLGAVLAAHAHSNESSPIKRGLFVRDRLLCQDLPPPPANLDTTPPGLDPTLTTRARFGKHTASAACSGCHQFIDGVGFGFEGFDGIGQLRTVENGLPVDTSGELRGLESLGEPTRDAFQGTRALSELLAESPNAQRCMTLQYYRFARGYEERDQDACSLDKLQQGFANKDLTIKELLVQLAMLDSFTRRRAE
jgi:hypothetical protein